MPLVNFSKTLYRYKEQFKYNNYIQYIANINIIFFEKCLSRNMSRTISQKIRLKLWNKNIKNWLYNGRISTIAIIVSNSILLLTQRGKRTSACIAISAMVCVTRDATVASYTSMYPTDSGFVSDASILWISL